MKSVRNLVKSWGFYLAYTFVLTLVFLYLLFPGAKLVSYIERSVSHPDSGIVLAIDKIRPALPIGLELSGGKIVLTERPDICALKVDRLTVFPHIRSCVSERVAFDLKAFVCQGEIAGAVRFDGYDTSGPFDTDIHIKGVALEDMAALQNLTGRAITGRLSGDITYNYKSGAYMRGKGESSLVVSDGSVELLLPFLDPGPVKFHSIETVAKLANGKLTIEELKFKSDLFLCDLSGNITLARRMENSVMNLRGSIEPLESFSADGDLSGALLTLLGGRTNKKKIPFTVRGTIREPKVRFM